MTNTNAIRTVLSREICDAVVICTENQSILDVFINCVEARRGYNSPIPIPYGRTLLAGIGKIRCISVQHFVDAQDFDERNIEFSNTRTIVFEFQHTFLTVYYIDPESTTSERFEMENSEWRDRLKMIREHVGEDVSWK